MYALRDYIGEDRVNAALKKFIRDHAFENAPYTTAGELVRYFREVTPQQYQNVVTDLFERIILFDNQTREASATKRADGKYVVKLTVASTKLRSDAKGEEKPVPIDDWIDIGVFGPGKKETLGKPLFVEKRHITTPLFGGGKECQRAAAAKAVQLNGTISCVNGADCTFRVANSTQQYPICEKTKTNLRAVTGANIRVTGKIVSCEKGAELLIEKATKI